MRKLLLSIICFFFAVGVARAGPRDHDTRAYRLVDQKGRSFALADLRGEPTFVTFVASRCTDACPLVNGMFNGMQERMRREHLRAHLLTITLDPDYDTPFVMASLARRFAADELFWRVASGDRTDVEGLMHVFGVVAEKGTIGVPDVHSTFVYLLDRRGRLLRTLLASTTLADQAVNLLKASDHGPR